MVSGAFRVGDGHGPVLGKGLAEAEEVENLDKEETEPDVGADDVEHGLVAGVTAVAGVRLSSS